MDKKKKQLVLIGLLVPVLVFVVYNSANTIKEQKAKKVRPPATKPVEAIAPVELPPAARTEQEVFAGADEKIIAMQSAIAEGPWDRDPFQPPFIKESERISQDWMEYQLTGIIAGRMAIINGEPVLVGEEYRGYRLQEAGQYRIILEKDDQSFILNIPED